MNEARLAPWPNAAPARKAPVGKEPGGGLLLATDWTNGKALSRALRKFAGIIGTSNIPKPARTEVLPVLNGSQANPIRGSKFRSVGLWNNGLPLNCVAPVRLCSV